MYGANVPSRCCKGIVKCTGKALGMYGIKLLQMYGTRYKVTVAGTGKVLTQLYNCLLYTSPSPRDLSTSRMPSSA